MSTEHINENYLRVKEKFLRAIDYVENINVDKPTTNDPPSRHKRDSKSPFDTRTTPEEIKYLTQLLSELAAWDPINNYYTKEEKVYTTLCFNWSCYWFYCEMLVRLRKSRKTLLYYKKQQFCKTNKLWN